MNLKQKFHHRDSTFARQTKTIMDSLTNITDGAREFIRALPDTSYQSGTVVWEDVSLVGENIMLVGVLRYTTGATFMYNNEVVEITDANKDYWQRVMHVGLPVKLAEEGTKEEVIQYLRKMYDSELNEIEEVLKEIKEEFSTPEEEFDLDQLSDEQRKQLQMYKGEGGLS